MINDNEAMLRAIALGEKARTSAPPNPWVGCVLIKDNRIIGEGCTQQNGRPHAETVALLAAGPAAEGATAYVSLEPCSHFGKTSPCASALIQAKVAHVVIAIEDPDIRVSGKGIHMLREAGIIVTLGICAAEATRSLKPYLWQRKTGRAFCHVKAAMSVDGRIAAPDHSSQWITCPEARLDTHILRAESQAILIGSGTALNDKPSLTVRHMTIAADKQPLRVILDPSGKVLPPSPLFDTTLAPTLIITSSECAEKAKQAWSETGVEVVELSLDSEGGIDLLQLLKFLGKRGIIQVLVEGGGTLLGNLMRHKLIDQLTLYMGTCILGDKGLPLFKNLDIKNIEEAPKLELINFRKIGDTLRLDYTPIDHAYSGLSQKFYH